MAAIRVMSSPTQQNQALVESSQTTVSAPETTINPKQIESASDLIFKEKEIACAANTQTLSACEEGVVQPESNTTLVVGWDAPEEKDHCNPLNWSTTRKWANILVISAISFLV